MKYLLVLLLSGCASLPTGVTMSAADREACAAEGGCTVWTPAELERLVGLAMRRGFQAGQTKRNSI